MKTGVTRAFGRLAFVGLLVGGVGTAAAQPAVSAWPLFHANVQRTGRTTVVGPANPNNVRIAFQGFGSFRTSPAIGPDGTVYVSSSKKLCAIDPMDDSIKWCADVLSNVHFASPAIGIDPMNASKVVIYQGGRDNKMHQVDQDGVLRWTYLVGVDGDVASSAVMNAAGNVFFGGSTRFHSIPPTGGTPNWVRGLESFIFLASPALSLSGSAVYVGTSTGSLYSFSTDNAGTENWKLTVGRRIRYAGPAVGPDGTIYIGTRDGLVSVTDNGMSATINWTFPMSGSGVASTPAIGADGTIYVGGHGGQAGAGAAFFAIPANWQPNQPPLWVYQTNSFFRGSPILDGAGRIYTTSGRSVIALNSANGNLVWTFATSRNIYSSPALDAAGTLWVTGADRNLYAISN